MTVVFSDIYRLVDIFMGPKPDPDWGVYKVRDGTEIIYVGSSKRIRYRLINDHRRDNSPLWQEILNQMPGSLTWTVVIEEIKLDDLFGHNSRKREAELIQRHKPRLNEYMQPERLR